MIWLNSCPPLSLTTIPPDSFFQENLITTIDLPSIPLSDSRYKSLVLSELRLATKAKHDILDKTMPLAKPDANWADYISHLQILHSWLKPLEKWLSDFTTGPQGQGAPAFIYYSEAISADLYEAKIPLTASDQLADWPKNDGAAYRWGICYVIEGSQLGGEFLYNRLAARLAPHPLSYLQKKNAGRWSEFLQAMALQVTEPQHISAACAGAIDAFDALLIKLRT